MKKLFTLIVAVFVGMSAYADNTIEGLITSHLNAGINYISLEENVTYTLNGPVSVGYTEFTIKGNGAKIIASATGQIQTKKSLTIDNVVLDASASTVAPIAMAPKADMATAADSAACYTFTKDATGAYKVNKYENATNACFEAQLVSITNSTIKSATSFITGGNAPWALRKLNVDNCIISTTATSGKAFLNWEEGAAQIKDIVISNSTLYATSQTYALRFHRYSNSVDPWRVWGYATDTDKNAPGLNTWTLTNNTFINLCGNSAFSNNVKSSKATSVTCKKNIFANTMQLQKLQTTLAALVGFTAADNAISLVSGSVDNTDKTNWATEDNDMKVFCTSADDYQFAAAAGSYAYKNFMGDPRWFTNYQKTLAPLDAEVANANAMLKKYNSDPYNKLEEYDVLKSEVAKACDMIDQPTAPSTDDVTKEINKLKAAEAALMIKTGISTVNAETPAINNGRAYNLAGQRVNANAKGIVIINGKKYFNK